jgi:hypothetical protein
VERTVFTTDILFGMNILSLAGVAVLGLSLTLRHMPAVLRALAGTGDSVEK